MTLRSKVPAAAAALVLFAGAASADVVIPSTVYRRGANSAEFRSDVRVFNPTGAPINYTPVLHDQVTGQTFTAPLQTIPSRAQQAFDNIVGTLFGKTLDDGAFGPIRFQTTGALVVSSSVNNYNACGNGAVSGQWLPGLDASQAIAAGTLVQLAASADSGSGYRSNVVFTNPGASSATVRAKLRKGDGTLLNDVTLPTLSANGFTQIGALAAWLPSPNTITDTNLWLEFTSDQPVLSFASVINNQSGDPFAIVMTNEPPSGAGAPLANYSVSANPTAGQPVTFTDTSTGGAVLNRFWVFGDGTTQVGGSPAVKTYSAAGTYKTWLFVDNASGANSTTKDVVVASGQPIAVTISATTTNNTKWTFVCQSPASVCSGTGNNNVNLAVGQPYTITWTTPASEAKTHGVAGIAVLGITQCDVIRPVQPCTVSFTPTAAMRNFPGPVYTYACSQNQCAPSQAAHDGMTGTITIVP